ncbi:MAG TPA: hypothetical protein DDW52_04610 [Planctomycetaceae bacterium]|nr:hypothetical protein [Planctomycetaceae bacterium]
MPSLPRRDNPLGLRIFDSEAQLDGSQESVEPQGLGQAVGPNSRANDALRSTLDQLDDEPTDEDLAALEASCIAGRIDPLDPFEREPVRVCVGAGEVFELLRDAISTNRAWLEDFKDDTIEIPQDMYEILVAYKDLVYRRAA